MPTVTLTPDPPVHNDPLCLTTDGTLPKKLDITYKLSGGGTSTSTITLVEAKGDTSVPATATSVTVHDVSGECADESRVVV